MKSNEKKRESLVFTLKILLFLSNILDLSKLLWQENKVWEIPSDISTSESNIPDAKALIYAREKEIFFRWVKISL